MRSAKRTYDQREAPSEYDVVSLRLSLGTVSLLCAVLPVTVGILADELPFLLGGRLRPYYGVLLSTALGSAVAGIVLGIVAARRASGGAAGRMGILVNALVLALLGLFVVIFRWIRWGAPSWF